MMRQHIEPGWEVVGSDGRKIGIVKGCAEKYCHIDTGFLGLGPDYFVPMDAIYNVRPNEVILNVRSDEVGQMGWERHPQTATSASTMAAPAAATRRADVAQEPGFARDVEGRAGTEPRTMPLREEELHAQKYREQVGEVDITREVREEVQNIEIPVTREEVVVRTRPASGPAGGPIGKSETLRIPVSEERVTVTKETHVYGEVEIEKQLTTEQRRVSDTIRREVPRVERKGEVRGVENQLDQTADERAASERQTVDQRAADLAERERISRENPNR